MNKKEIDIDNEILHSDDNGIVMVIRFNNEKEE